MEKEEEEDARATWQHLDSRSCPAEGAAKLARFYSPPAKNHFVRGGAVTVSNVTVADANLWGKLFLRLRGNYGGTACASIRRDPIEKSPARPYEGITERSRTELWTSARRRGGPSTPGFSSTYPKTLIWYLQEVSQTLKRRT